MQYIAQQTKPKKKSSIFPCQIDARNVFYHKIIVQKIIKINKFVVLIYLTLFLFWVCEQCLEWVNNKCTIPQEQQQQHWPDRMPNKQTFIIERLESRRKKKWFQFK